MKKQKVKDKCGKIINIGDKVCWDATTLILNTETRVGVYNGSVYEYVDGNNIINYRCAVYADCGDRLEIWNYDLYKININYRK